MTANHLMKKLRRMSGHEVLWRTKALAVRLREEQAHRLGLATHPEPASTHLPLRFAYPFMEASALDQVAAALRTDDPAYVDRVLARAEALVRGEFEFFGRTFMLDPGNMPWTADPVTGHRWPMRFHTKVDIFSGNVGNGDVKFVWELNRHQFLVTLGKAWRLTDDTRYAETALGWLDSWYVANPYRMGINWTSALEHAVRSLSWLTTAGLLDNAPSFTDQRRMRLRTALYQHGLYLDSHLSFYFSPYNHLIGEATALHAIGSLVPSLPSAEAWQRSAWQILTEEVTRQFHPDGGTVEQAFGYHHFTLGFYLQSWLIARATGQQLPAALLERLVEAWRFSATITRPDGRVPMVGDADEGKALDLEQAHPWDFSAYQAVGRALAGPGLLAGTPAAAPDAAWLVGTEPSVDVHEPLRDSNRCLQSSGYVVLSDHQHSHWLLFDAGDIADGVPEDDEVSAAHGHADLLALELTVHGRPRLIDPGFLTYNGPVPWHRYFRDTQAHNALVVDDRSQATYRGRLKWSNGASARLHVALADRAMHLVQGSHAAYGGRPDGVVHQRTVVWMRPDLWIVRDHLQGQGTHLLDRYWHFATESVAVDGLIARTTDAGPGDIEMRALEPDTEIALTSGQDAPSGGWVAERYEVKRPAAVVRQRVTRDGPAALYTAIAVAGQCVMTDAVSYDTADASGISLPMSDGTRVMAVWAVGSSPIVVGGLTMTTRAAFIVFEGDEVMTVGCLGASLVMIEGTTCHDSAGPENVVARRTQDGFVWNTWEALS